MKISNFILKAANTLVSFVIMLFLIIVGVYACYALWDNNLIYAAADNVQADMLKLKPDIEEEQGPSFEELLAINPDVKAWITVDNTNIDYPVLQGDNNLSYINTDVYGNFALSGSIFLDSRNDGNFNDTYSLIYGHYMEKDKMFGNLALFKDEEYFEEHQTGTLILPDRVYGLKVYAVLLVDSTDDMIFDPGQWQGENINKLIDYANNNALNMNKGVIENIEQSEYSDLQILALSTCSDEYAEARTVVLTIMENVSAAE